VHEVLITLAELVTRNPPYVPEDYNSNHFCRMRISDRSRWKDGA